MAEVTITTDLDLDKVAETYGKLIAKETMAEIGQAYRTYRQQMMWQGKQLHDLSASPPLKPETIARKRGDYVRKTRYISKTNPKGYWHEVAGERVYREKTITVHGTSLAPDVPLIDTGNLAKNIVISAKAGALELTIGPQRAEIGAYHQAGSGHLPVRVHLSWNNDFVKKYIVPIIANYYERQNRKAVHTRRALG